MSTEPTTVFTDASMSALGSHTVNDAGLAVVTKPKPNSNEIEQIVNTARHTQQMPASSCYFTGKVVGRQTVNRGELLAGAIALDVSKHLH